MNSFVLIFKIVNYKNSKPRFYFTEAPSDIRNNKTQIFVSFIENYCQFEKFIITS